MRTNRKKGRLARRAIALLFVVSLLFTLAPQVTASPVSDKQGQLQNIKSEVQTLDAQMEAVTEQYNLENIKAEKLRAAISDNQTQLEQVQSDLAFRQQVLASRIRELYMQGNTSMIEVLTESKNTDDFISNMDLMRRVDSSDASAIQDYLATKSELDATAANLQERKAALAATMDNLASQKSQIEGALQQRQQLIAGVESEIAALIAADEAARAAAPRIVASRPPSYTPPPLPGGNAADVVRIAYEQLGKPYVYAGSGPNVFDCSGLVMYCYAQIGISLPHYSYSQYNCGPHVAYEDLQPGDLVFFRSFGHVGMYVGDGIFIQAPSTGDVVKLTPLASRRDFCGACRIL